MIRFSFFDKLYYSFYVVSNNLFKTSVADVQARHTVSFLQTFLLTAIVNLLTTKYLFIESKKYIFIPLIYFILSNNWLYNKMKASDKILEEKPIFFNNLGLSIIISEGVFVLAVVLFIFL
jgi:hypothetical protein